MARVVDCRFLRFSCGHDLFNATYTRSNRTKGTKIMRCFPHCCPEHMPRCYCGCSLQVLVQFDALDPSQLDDLLVCARFETSEQQEPRHAVPLGSAMAIPKALLSTNPDDANATAWVLAERESDVKQRQVAENAVLYVMNNHRFPRWYYSYESGATKNQREMRHHLTVYILQRTRASTSSVSSSRARGGDRGGGDMEHVRVVGRLPSPAFKLVSYRRARGEVKKPLIPQRDDPLAALEDHGGGGGGGCLSSEEEEAEEEEEEEENTTISGSAQGTPTKRPPASKDAARRAKTTKTTAEYSDSSSNNGSPVSRSSEMRVPDAVDMPETTASAAASSSSYSLARDLARRRANSSPFVSETDRQRHIDRDGFRARRASSWTRADDDHNNHNHDQDQHQHQHQHHNHDDVCMGREHGDRDRHHDRGRSSFASASASASVSSSSSPSSSPLPSSVPMRKRKASSPAVSASVWWRQHADDAQRVLHLHVLFVMLHRLSLHDVLFCVREKSERLRKKWFDKIAAATLHGSKDAGATGASGANASANAARLVELARVFCLSAFAEDGARPPPASSSSGEASYYTHADSRAVIATCLDVLLEVVTSEAVAKLLQATWHAHASDVLESDQIRALFLQFVRRLHGAIDATVRNRRDKPAAPASTKKPQRATTGSSSSSSSSGSLGVAGLVDDAMTTVFREKRLLPLRRDMARALSDSSLAAERWYQVFVAQLRVAWVRFHERSSSSTTTSPCGGGGHINLLCRAVQDAAPPPLWHGKWLLDASSFRVRRPGGWFHHPQQNANGELLPLGSVVSWIVLLRQWMAVELAMDGSTLTATSLLTTGLDDNNNSNSTCGMKLILDERQRMFQSFPDGLASSIGSGGGDRGAWLHGDYVGRGREDASELLCESYSFRQRDSQRAEIVRMAVKSSIWSSGAGGARRCVVAVQVASATCGSFSAEQLLAWPVAARHERLYATAKWAVVADVEATYHDLK